MNMPCISRMKFPYKGGIHFIHPDQIIRLEADSNYTYIHVQNRSPILMAKVLSEYELLLEPFGFLRTHRSHLVNTAHVTSITLEGEILMDDESRAGISRRKRKKVLNSLFSFFTAA